MVADRHKVDLKPVIVPECWIIVVVKREPIGYTHAGSIGKRQSDLITVK